MEIGKAIACNLEAGKSPEDRRYVDHKLALEAGQSVQIDAMAQDFDSQVELLDPTGTGPRRANDDGGEGLDARLRFTAPRKADYVVRVRAADRQPGAYRLGVTNLDVPAAPFPSDPEKMLSLDGTAVLANGYPYAAYTFEGRAGERVAISMDAYSDAMDPRLEMAAQDDRTSVAENDDVDDSNNARLVVDLPRQGAYIVKAIGATAGQYKLKLERIAAVSAPPDGLKREDSVQRRLERSDLAVNAPGESISGFYKLFSLPVQAGERVTAVVSSADPSTFIPLLEVGAETLAGFAVAQRETASATAPGGKGLTFTPRASGTVLLRVRSVDNQTGTFSLQVTSAPASATGP